MDNRPGPSLNRWLELTVPPEDLAEAAVWHQLLIDYLEGRVPPGSARQPQVTARLREYAALTRRGAADFAAAKARACASASVTPVPVVAPAQAPAASGEWVTTTEAADLTGTSAAWWRQLAASGRVRARRTAHRAWLICKADVTAWTTGGNATDGARGRRAEQEDADGGSSAA